MGRYKKSWQFVIITMAFVGNLLHAKPTNAHGGGVLYLANELSGDFEVSAWVLPQVANTSEPLHIDILVLQPSAEGQANQDFILGADVNVLATYLGGDKTVVNEVAATVDTQNELFYQAIVLVSEAGEWQIDIDVRRGEEAGVASFVLDIEEDNRRNWYLIGGAVIVILAAAIFALRIRPPRDNA